MLDNGANDEKIICIPVNDPNYNHYTDIANLPKHVFDEMSHFFTVYKQLEGKDTVIDDVRDAAAAKQIVQNCIDCYVEKFCR